MTNAVTQWFRELPTPLIPSDRHDACLALAERADVNGVRQLVEKLDPENRACLTYFARYLRYLAGHADVTHMPCYNLAYIFAKSLLRLECDLKLWCTLFELTIDFVVLMIWALE